MRALWSRPSRLSATAHKTARIASHAVERPGRSSSWLSEPRSSRGFRPRPEGPIRQRGPCFLDTCRWAATEQSGCLPQPRRHAPPERGGGLAPFPHRPLACEPVRLLDRYLLRELLGPGAACLAGFLIFWVTADLLERMEDLQARSVPWTKVLLHYGWRIPEFLGVVLPLGLLLALLYALHRHSRYHEITAMRAAGWSLWRIGLPYLGVGMVSSALLLTTNEFLAPEAAARADQVLQTARPGQNDPALLRNFGFMNQREQRSWHMDTYHLGTSEMIGPQVDYRTAQGTRRWLFASRAIYTNEVWVFFEVREYDSDPQGDRFLTPVRRVPVLPMPEFTETPEMMRSAHTVRGRLERRAARKLDLPIRTLREFEQLHPDLTPEERAWLQTQWQGRLALPATCIVVVLIALPFGVSPGRRNVFYGVAGSIFVAFAYFVIQQLGLALGTGGHLAPWLAAWTPNLLFALLGIVLTLRIR